MKQESSTEGNEKKSWKSQVMHALVLNGIKRVDYREISRPKITEQTDLLLKITATSICSSDLSAYHGDMEGIKNGDILGHECMGVIVEVGSEVQNLKVGQRVVIAYNIACGKCVYCNREEYIACEISNQMGSGHLVPLYGHSHFSGGSPGAQAEYIVIPFADVNCLVIPDNISDEKALFLSDIIPNSYYSAILGDIKQGDTVAIWGLGPVGLLTARWCQILGANTIIGIDFFQKRLDNAKNVLGIETINFKEQNVIDAINNLVGSGGLDVALNCVGFYKTSLIHKLEKTFGKDLYSIFNETFTAVRAFGRVGVNGVYSALESRFPVGTMIEKNLTVKCGQASTQKYWKFALEKIVSGELDPTFIISQFSTLSDGHNLYKKYKKEEVIKVFLRPENIE